MLSETDIWSIKDDEFSKCILPLTLAEWDEELRGGKVTIFGLDLRSFGSGFIRKALVHLRYTVTLEIIPRIIIPKMHTDRLTIDKAYFVRQLYHSSVL
jgi:hypothetical protein